MQKTRQLWPQTTYNPYVFASQSPSLSIYFIIYRYTSSNDVLLCPIICPLLGIFIKNNHWSLHLHSLFWSMCLSSPHSVRFIKPKVPQDTMISISTYSILTFSAIFNFFVFTEHYPKLCIIFTKKVFQNSLWKTPGTSQKRVCIPQWNFQWEKHNLCL